MSEATLPHEIVRFAHNSERQFAKLLDFYGIEWTYEPRTFTLERDNDGRPAQAFSPDFYLPGFYSLARLPSREAWRDRLSDQLAFRTLFLIEDTEGRVVSAALSSAEGGGAAMLGGVATLDEYRGLGLSTLCVGALCEELFAQGVRSVGLFYLKDNVPAARVYARLGFKPASEWLLVPMGLGIVFG